MGALQYIDVPGYAALLLRRRITDSSLPGALLARAHEWLAGSGATWSEGEHQWRFASGATLSFGYLDQPRDRYRYQSSEFQYIAFDELTQFSEEEYTYLFSRLRRPRGLDVPPRMRGATNPGGVGHDWVRRRFLIEGRTQGRWFIPARLSDNPHLDQEEYRESLERLDSTTRAQLLEGDWEAGDDGLLPYDEILACEQPTLWRSPADRRGDEELYVGVDVGRTRDLTVIWTWERLGDVFWCRDMLTLAETSFSEQHDLIRERLHWGAAGCAIDKGGIGYQLAEELEREFPHVARGIALSAVTQGRLARRLAVAFRERRVRIPSDPALRADLRQVRRPRIVGGVDRVETARSELGHADRFWAAALGYEAGSQGEGESRGPASLPRSFRPPR